MIRPISRAARAWIENKFHVGNRERALREALDVQKFAKELSKDLEFADSGSVLELDVITATLTSAIVAWVSPSHARSSKAREGASPPATGSRAERASQSSCRCARRTEGGGLKAES